MSDTSRTPEPLVDWSRTARRLRLILSIIGGIVCAVWAGVGLFGSGFSLRLLAELLGLGLLASFAVEVVVVGGLAVRAMLAAGERGERLASADVHILPPQLLRRASPDTRRIETAGGASGSGATPETDRPQSSRPEATRPDVV